MALADLESLGNCTQQQYDTILGLVDNDASAASVVCNQFDVQTMGETNAVLQWTVRELHRAQEDIIETKYGLDTAFLLQSGYNVFIMQLGFALYAAGTIRAKNVVMIFIKSFTDACIAALSFWLIGFAFGFGGGADSNGFIGNTDFALKQTQESSPANLQYFYWNWAFCSAATTILSGSIAERGTFHAYMIYSFFITTWVYPVVAHWLWSPSGWLNPHYSNAILGIGAIDFAGSAVVHMVGGCASLAASIIVGPRTGRFDGTLPPSAFKGSSPSLYLMGTFLLWYGWYGFNPGSNLSVSSYDHAEVVARVACTTTLSGATGALAAMLLVWWRRNTWDLLETCTGCLAGLVAVTAGCPVIELWAAVIAGAVAAVVLVYLEALLEHVQIDDPVSAIPLHAGCGMWGVLFVGLLAKEEYIVQVYGKEPGHHQMGIFYGGHAQLLLCQVITVLVVAAWSSAWMVMLFGFLKKMGWLRVPLEEEAIGMDQASCGQMNGALDPRSGNSKLGYGGGVGVGLAPAAHLAVVAAAGAAGNGTLTGKGQTDLLTGLAMMASGPASSGSGKGPITASPNGPDGRPVITVTEGTNVGPTHGASSS